MTTNPRLPVIRQDCPNCPLKSKCWNFEQDPKADVLALNLVVCRMKLGIKRESSTRLFLQLLKPKLYDLVRFISSKVYIPDKRVLYMEAQSAAVEYILERYKLGERAWPLHYLFARPRGVMTGWALKYIARRQRELKEVSVGLSPDSDLNYTVDRINYRRTNGRVSKRPPDEPTESRAEISEIPVEAALAVVDDGATLSLTEYRVLSFCLRHAGEVGGRSPVTGLHKHMADRLQVHRKRVSKTYRSAAEKIVEQTGYTDRVLGLDKPPCDPKARRERMLGLRPPGLSDQEKLDLLELARKMNVYNACRAFGVNNRAYYTIKERYAADKSQEDRSDHG